jgi:hypothetical protein
LCTTRPCWSFTRRSRRSRSSWAGEQRQMGRTAQAASVARRRKPALAG